MKKLLLIEKDPDIREMVAFALENNGFEIIKTDKEVSVNEVITINPHVIIIGYMLGNTPGEQLCKKIKSDNTTGAIPVILYSTTLDGKKIAPKGYADAIVAKPFELEDLVHLASRLAYKN
ncbi:MAG TPA: response regulator [Mucilaginibacter sp.]|nr:response regulator [Mucilaginibacter sp.]